MEKIFKSVVKLENELGLTVRETKFIFEAAVTSNEWKRVPGRLQNACEHQQKRHLKNARNIVDTWILSGTKEYAFDSLSSSETGVLLIKRFKLWCKGRPKQVETPSAGNPSSSEVVHPDTADVGEDDEDWEDVPTEHEIEARGADHDDFAESDSDWEDVPTEHEFPARSDHGHHIVDEAASSPHDANRDSDGTSGKSSDDDVVPESPPHPPVVTPNSAYNDDKFVEDDKKFRPQFDVAEDTLWTNLTFLQVSSMLYLCFMYHKIHVMFTMCTCLCGD